MPTHISGLSDRILDVIPDMFILYDRNGVILDILHPNTELMISPESESAIGMRLMEGKLKKRSEPYIGYFYTVCDTRQPCRFVYRYKKPDGKEKFYEVFLSYIEGDRILADIRKITNHSVAQIESKHLRYFFAEVLDNIAIPISVKSMDTGQYVYWSKKAEIFGRTTGEMIGGTEDLYMSPEQARIIRQIDRQLLEGKEKQYQGSEKYITNDGKEHTFIVTRTLFTFGEEKLILNSALDISELKETQTSLLSTKDELARKNMTLYSVLSLAKVIPWGCDLIQQTFYCDYNAYHPDNAPTPDEHGRYVIPMDRYFAGVHPDYRNQAVQMIADLIEGKQQEFHEIYLVHWFNDEEWEWVQVQCCVAEYNIEGRPVRLIGSAQRITEQKKTELALRKTKEDLAVKNVILSSVLSIAQVIPWGCDLKAETFYCDYDTYHHESAVTPDEKGRYTIPTKEYFTRIHPDYQTQIYDQYNDLIEGRADEFHEVYPIHWYNDREYEWVETHQSRISQDDSEEKTIQLIGSARVVTSQKRMEESLREAKEQAERSNTLKSAFLANMSHEIRTPLNAIVGFSELLAQTEEEDEKQEYLSIIRNSNALLLQLIDDILDLSKIEAGTLEFSFADHDLNALMDELEQTARIKVNNPAVEVACTDQIPNCTIHTDRGRLLQVLHNFINNAAKFTEQGHIHFGFRRHTDKRWYFYVEDTGCGIASDKMDSVFERFVKLSKKAKGTGLGLAISKSIIERLGGQIGVFSAEGQGSTFWFLLPAGCITTSTPVAETGTKVQPATDKTSGPISILVAEDDPANYKLFEAVLQKHYTLFHAWNGRQAIEMFKENHPNIILMDIKMPEVDGYEATATIRKLSTDVPILAVTAFAYPEDMQRILSSGFNGFLSKPIKANDLRNKISEMCP